VADKDEAVPTGPSSDAGDLPPELADADPEHGAAHGSTVLPASRKVPTPKGTPTAKRDVEAAEKRTTPVAFVQQSVGELRKVVYPTGQQLGNYFVVVLVFVLFIIALVSLLDLGIGKLVFAIFS
jgi:preprotein translocase subunit SecE